MDGIGFGMVVWLPFIFVAVIVGLALGYAAIDRYLRNKERMAMIEKGIDPSGGAESPARHLGGSKLSRGLTTTLIGLAITLGLLTIGIGPWLLGGLIPMAVGGGMLISHYLEGDKGEDEN